MPKCQKSDLQLNFLITCSSHSYGARQTLTLRNFVLPGPIMTKLGMVDYVGDPYSDASFN